MTFVYLALNLLTLAGPILLSFDRRISFYRRWKTVIISILPTAALFLAWDIYFTRHGIWSFNDEYIIGVKLVGMPIEEWLFFCCIPFACVFIYEVVLYFGPGLRDLRVPSGIILSFALLLLGASLVHWDLLYTRICFLSGSLMIVAHWMVFRDRVAAGFLCAYAVHLAPFFLVNGILTGLPVVLYNNEANLGVRLGTIPLEDTVYSFTLLLGVITVYELLRCPKMTTCLLVVLLAPGMARADDHALVLQELKSFEMEYKRTGTLEDEMEVARRYFYLAVEDEAYMEQALAKFARARDHGADPVLVDIYGAAIESLRAKHAFWPLRKLSLANRALARMDEAAKGRLGFEAKFILASTLHYLPGFMGRSDEADRYVKEVAAQYRSEWGKFPKKLYQSVGDFLLESDRLSDDEMAELKKMIACARASNAKILIPPYPCS